MRQWNCSSLSAVVSGITSGKKCIEKLYPLKNINRYTFEIPPLPRTYPPSPKRGLVRGTKGQTVYPAQRRRYRYCQERMEEKECLTISTVWVYNDVAIVPMTEPVAQGV